MVNLVRMHMDALSSIEVEISDSRMLQPSNEFRMLVAWRLRHEAFQRFGYDPDQVFCERVDEHGFKK